MSTVLPSPSSRRAAPGVRLARSVIAIGLALSWVALTGDLGAAGADAELPEPSAAGLTVSERYDALVARAAHERAGLETLEAEFVQLKESRFLLTPEESSGTFSYRSPDKVRWHFTSPIEVITILRGSEMLTWSAGQDQAEHLDVGRQADHILALLGPSASLTALERYFTVRVTFPATAGEPYRLQLDPRVPRIERRIQSMTLHLDPQRYMPIFIRIEEPGDQATELRFESMKINGEMPETRFELEVD